MHNYYYMEFTAPDIIEAPTITAFKSHLELIGTIIYIELID